MDRLLLLSVVVALLPSATSFVSSPNADSSSSVVLPRVWIEAAEEGFVDDEENLEEGEICLTAVKAFAQTPDHEKLLLCAGALIERNSGGNSNPCRHAWTADALTEPVASPNLRVQGALLVLQALMRFHTQDDDKPLQAFVLHCGAGVESEFTCASYQAAQMCGFQSLAQLVRQDSDTFRAEYYDYELDGMVLGNRSFIVQPGNSAKMCVPP